MKRTDPIWIEYVRTADAVRCGDESPEMLASYNSAKKAYDEARSQERANEPKRNPEWWNLPVAASCWYSDAAHLER